MHADRRARQVGSAARDLSFRKRCDNAVLDESMTYGLVYDAPAGARNCLYPITGGLHRRLIFCIPSGLRLQHNIPLLTGTSARRKLNSNSAVIIRIRILAFASGKNSSSNHTTKLEKVLTR